MTQRVNSFVDTNIFSLLSSGHTKSAVPNHYFFNNLASILILSSADEEDEEDSEDEYDYEEDETQESMEWSETSSERGSDESTEDYEERMEDLGNFSDRF